MQSSSMQLERETASKNESLELKFISKTIMFVFPFNLVAFFAAGMLKLLRSQMISFLRFITFPILLLNSCIMFILQNLLIPFISSRLNPYKPALIKLAIRLSRAVLCSLYVLLVLIVFLVSSFAISGYVMSNLAEAPIHITQNLNFDYTKTSPTAVVLISSPLVPKPPSRSTRTPFDSSPRRAVSSRQRLRLTVSLTLPESEFNRKLGIFQVRVESLSANADVIVGSSYPMMLRFKSRAVRVIESSIKMLPLVTGMRSEVQNLRTVIEEFGERKERIIGFKVSLEKRSSASQLEDGCGVPEIYDATLAIESKLPVLKRMVWNWRLTVFVWLAFASFVAEMMVVFLFLQTCSSSRKKINEKSG